MKRLLLVAVAVAFAATAWAAETVKVTEKVKGDETKTTITEKAKGEKEKIKIDEKSTTTTVTDVTKFKQGDVAKDTVQFEKYEANGDYVYVMKDSKLIRLKHTFSTNVKQDMLKLKKGDTIKITSTHPLTHADMAVLTGFELANTPVSNPANVPVKK